MTDILSQLGEFATILLLAVALGMDAFSLGVGIGMKGIRRSDCLRIGAAVALFHLFMPLLGMVAGQYAGFLLGQFTRYVSGGLLVLLGSHMIVSSFKSSELKSIDHRSFWGVMLFSLSVSVDSLSVGVSLGMFQIHVLFTVLAFCIAGGLMSILGLVLGRSLSKRLSDYGEAVGGAILLAFGLLFVF